MELRLQELRHGPSVRAGLAGKALKVLRVVGKLLFGPVQDEHHRTLTDATWWERISVVTLILCVAIIGCFPNFFINIISSSFDPVVKALQAALPNVL